jgi:mannosyl-oligosaccharide glucosidase
MTGGGSRGTTRRPAAAASRSRGDPSSSGSVPDARRAAAAAATARRSGRGDHGPLRVMAVSARTLLLLGIASVSVLSVAFMAYTGGWWQAESESEGAAALRRMARSVTPLDAPRMMDLPQVRIVIPWCYFCRPLPCLATLERLNWLGCKLLFMLC